MQNSLFYKFFLNKNVHLPSLKSQTAVKSFWTTSSKSLQVSHIHLFGVWRQMKAMYEFSEWNFSYVRVRLPPISQATTAISSNLLLKTYQFFLILKDSRTSFWLVDEQVPTKVFRSDLIFHSVKCAATRLNGWQEGLVVESLRVQP